jgi:pantetheine-phosphate adenylyltransferase
VEVDQFEGLLVKYAASRNAGAILRGIRAVSDFDYEFQMALMNRRLDCNIETVFLVPAEAYTYLSSTLVKEVVALGGSVSGLVPAEVEALLEEKLKTL